MLWRTLLLRRPLLNLRLEDKPSLFSPKQIYEVIPSARGPGVVLSQREPEVNITAGEVAANAEVANRGIKNAPSHVCAATK